ncbi:MAG TPA: tetratricopeptide repeat protein [Smithella sp.]|nr:tetratricopeptide repeat protein [Smithella sp.]
MADGKKVKDASVSRSRREKVSTAHTARETTGIMGILQSSPAPGWLWGMLLALAAIIAYGPLWHAGFIWDDDTFLFNNPLIKQADGLYQFWFTAKAPDYFPLTSTTLWLEWRIWNNNPLVYHIVNVLLHALSAVLIWRVLVHLKIPGAWLAAALFAVHPVNVESVAWITERKNTLSMLFYVTSILYYLKFEETDMRRLYAIALCSFMLALLSKTAVAPMPFVLLGIVWWRRGRITSRDVTLALPFFGAALLMGMITIWFQSHNAIGAEIVRADNFWSRLAAAGMALWFYLYKALVPVNLIFVYPRWQVDGAKLISYIPGLLAIAGFAVLWRNRSKGWGKASLFGFSYFVVMLLPVLGFRDIYFMRFSLVADHWQYFAIIGPIALAAAGITHASARLEKKYEMLAPVVCAILLLILGALTWRQTCPYIDSETLWKTTIAKNPACFLAHEELGNIYKEKGQFDEAINQYQETIRLNPGYAGAYYNRGIAYAKLEQYQPAIESYNEAIRLSPDDASYYNNRGSAYLKLGRYQQAFDDFGRAIRLKPDYADAYYNRGIAYGRLEQYAPAIEDLNSAIRLKPDYADAYNNRAIIYFLQGNNELGCNDAKKACDSGNCKALELAKGNKYCNF